MAARIAITEVRAGEEIPPLSKVVRREEVKAYADASGDQNPLHQDDDFARGVGFPGIIAHGMYSMAAVAKAVTDWLGDPGALKRMKVQFRAVVYMDETLVARGRIVSVDERSKTALLSLWAEVEREGRPQLVIKNGEAEVEFA